MKKFSLTRKNGISLLLLLSLLLLPASGFFGCESDSESKATKIKSAVDDALASATYRAGISVAVYKGGDSMWTYAAGYANCMPDDLTRMTTSTPTFAYSITKTFISALVLTQIEDGRYTLAGTVNGLLSTNTDYNNLSAGQKALLNTSATVEQLLKHTSGMPNYADNLTALIPMCNPASSWKPADILENVVYQAVVPGWIGTQPYHYSNTNYILLGMIAQEQSVGKQALNTLLADNFFSPLNIDVILAPQDAYPSDIAHPYDDAYVFGLGLPVGTYIDFSAGIKLLNPAYDIYTGIGRGTWTAGGIISTADNLAIWGYELYDDAGTAISTTVRATLKGSVTSDGDYGYGVEYNDFTYTDNTAGGTYSHGGSAPGYKTLLIYEKTKGISIAIITNENNSVDGTGLIDQTALAAKLFNAYENE